MNTATMQFRRSDVERVAQEIELVRETLEPGHRDLVEIGCGRAEVTRQIAAEDPNRRLLALEIDALQHAKNVSDQAAEGLPNVRFALAGAQAIPAEDASCDVVFLFKSLHHVPPELLDVAFFEIHRVLRPGGLVHVSEPLPEGPAYDVLRLFHDETRARERAFEALCETVREGTFEFVSQTFYLAPVHFRDFEDYEARIIRVTHENHVLDDACKRTVRERLERHLGEDGIHFLTPQRVDRLRKPR